MTIAFRPGWTVSCLEADSTRPVEGMRLRPTEETLRRLADCGLVLRPRPAGLALYLQHMGGAGGPRRVQLVGKVALVFGLEASSGFWTRYLPDLTSGTGPQIYLSNRITATQLRPEGPLTTGAEVDVADAVRIVAPRFSTRADLGATPRPKSMAVATALTPRRNLPDVALGESSGEGLAEVDLTGEAETTFVLAPKPPATARRRVHVCPELAGRGVAGVLELVLDPVAGPDPPGGRAFTALFRKRV